MRPSPWLAWPAGSDPAALAERVRRGHESFLAGGPAGDVRPVVLASWRRSLSRGVDPERPRIAVDVSSADLAAYRRSHELAPLMPLVRRLLLDSGGADGIVVAVADEAGRLLWVEGDRTVRLAVEGAGFVEGASWREDVAGTNAPGMALATDHAVQVFAAEHFACPVQPWSCSAAPIHAPDGRLLGALDLTGADAAAAPHMLSLVRATVAALEAELAVRQLRAPSHRAPGAGPAAGAAGRASARRHASTGVVPAARLAVLGRSAGLVEQADGSRAALTLRHSELLLLLAAHPRGLSADELAVALHPGTLSDVTVRAEMSRLRRAVGPLVGSSRPYRLATPVRTDVDDVRAALAAGDLAAAVHAYAGPVLPRSQAPAVVELRDEVDAELRAAVEQTDDVEAVLAWALGPGAEDWAAWRRLTAILPAGSPAAARARARLAVLERALR